MGEADEVMTPYALFNLSPNAEVVAGGGDFITAGWCWCCDVKAMLLVRSAEIQSSRSRSLSAAKCLAPIRSENAPSKVSE